MTAAARAQVWLSPVVAISLVLVSAFSLLAFLVLSAYAPDLRSGSDGGAHALSTSAIGFAGIVRLLGDDGIPVVVDRGFLAKGREGASLMVLTPGAFGDPSKLVAVDPDGPRLIVLPKWDVALDPMARGWVRKIDTLDAGLIVDSTVKTLSASTKLSRSRCMRRAPRRTSVSLRMSPRSIPCRPYPARIGCRWWSTDMATPCSPDCGERALIFSRTRI
jgi:hypothetical protein